MKNANLETVHIRRSVGMTKPQIRAATARATYSVDEAAAKLGLNRNSAYAGVKAGTIPSIRVGGRLLVPKAMLDRMLGTEDPTP
jgi:excisionase family DNA binding protein